MKYFLLKLAVLVFTIVTAILMLTIILFSYNFDLDFLPNLPTTEMRVVCIGLPRTGTCSLTVALQRLGYNPQHFPINMSTKLRTYIRKRDALLDVTMLGYRPKDIVKLFPNARYIYTTRSDLGWLKSMNGLLILLNRFRFVPGVLEVIQGFVATFGSTYDTFMIAKRKYESELRELENEGKIIHRVNISDKSITSEKKWIDVQKACGIVTDLSHTRFPHESHIRLHIAQAWAPFIGNVL